MIYGASDNAPSSHLNDELRRWDRVYNVFEVALTLDWTTAVSQGLKAGFFAGLIDSGSTPHKIHATRVIRLACLSCSAEGR